MMKTLKTKLAHWLSKQTEKQKAATKKFMLLSFCLLVGGYTIGLVFGFVQFKFSVPHSISKPALPNDIAAKGRGIKDTEQYLIKFHRYMDSLGTSASGRMQRDRILQKHPGIMDTVARFEQMIIHSK